ncbi:DAN domain family member 5-like [Pelodytes ibericus]
MAAPHRDEDGLAPTTKEAHSFLNPPLFKNAKKTEESNRIPGDPSMDQEALQRRQAWESAMAREDTPHPPQVLHIDQEALIRERCEALPFVQNLHRKHCLPMTIPNKFCFGQCNSFYVPGKAAGHRQTQPCTRCVAMKSRRISVALQCRYGRIFWEEVELVQECHCVTQRERAAQTGATRAQ